MRRRRFNSEHDREQGVIITLVAVFMLFVLGAMAALSIDVVTFYTARSEAQLAADGAALAGARVLANSGMTSDQNAGSDGVSARAQLFAQAVAMQVAKSNPVGGRTLLDIEILVGFSCASSSPSSNPCITVRVQRNDLPTFFAHIWGSTQITVAAVAAAEAYNPTLSAGITAIPGVPVATSCVKPWLLPNLDPTSGTTTPTPIFVPGTGAIPPGGALWGWGSDGSGTPMHVGCPSGDCSGTLTPTPWHYFPANVVPPPAGPNDFPEPAASSVDCSQTSGFSGTPYQLTVAGCVPTPISCNQFVNIDTSPYTTRDFETAPPVNCLNHSTAGLGDKIDQTAYPPGPFEFLTGGDNPLVQAGAVTINQDVFVSDSLVTVPVFDCSPSCTGPLSSSSVQVIGFVQLFLSPLGTATTVAGPNTGYVSAAIINLVGCGTGSVNIPPVVGNGPSAVPVRLISPPAVP